VSKSRLGLIAAVVAAAALGFLFLPVREWFQLVRGSVEALGPVAPVAVAAAYAVLTVLLVPGSALTVGAGTLFGLWTGLAVVLAGANVGALCSFLLAKTFMRDTVARWAEDRPGFAALDRATGREGFKVVLLTRLSPVFPFTLLNYFLGLTRVRTISYVAGNLIGMLPGTFLYVYIGATTRDALSGGSGDRAASMFSHALTVVGLLATVAVVAVVTRAARRALAEADRGETGDESSSAPDDGRTAKAPDTSIH
jgi:uncharacterized membrane protein YdjX (TVP38/TMEM64 family)